ncbi:MetQ/NlpA family ABC transporter substrate-binding protein [Kurthia senegalensis]|uniref:MetQ/NlpA family ABC transporter substrate-binding protein n=1 Tax=Kurthia senegalensis TaxID=1033740 RepID=UPI000288BC60|nr:MetQ/NlpA family ABC transporter substrate-binding protein [Kurthia senegalensis]
MKKWFVAFVLVIVAAALAACGNGDSKDTTKETTSKTITVGATAGPYSDMLKKAIIPGLEEKGYKVTLKEFSDYIQPNNALDNGDIDANLFQHSIYLKNFNKENGTKLKALIIVPTAPMGFFSSKYKTIADLPEGAKISIANDPVNLARTLKTLNDEGLIEVDPDVDPLVASTKDITKNPKNFEFREIEAGGLPRAIETSDLAGVPGNFALAAGLDLQDALFLENMPDQYRNVVAVREADEKSQLAKDLKEIVESKDFENTIDEQFKGFGKPDWMKNR